MTTNPKTRSVNRSAIRSTTTRRAALAGALTLCVLAAGCVQRPEIDRSTRKPHTSHRGGGFTRLIATFNEANALARAASDQAAYLEEQYGDNETIRQANELARDARSWADDIEWALTNQRRVPRNRAYMNTLWDRYTDLFPRERELVEDYTSGKTRRYYFQRKYKIAYRENYGIERAEPRWEDIKPVIRQFYETDENGE